MRKIDFPIRILCNHLFGEQHTKNHRIGTGVAMAIGGVCVAKIHVDNFILYLIVDLVGYGLHGFGLLPLFAHFEGLATEEKLKEVESELESVESELGKAEGEHDGEVVMELDEAKV
jgi:hypothetical protein